MSLTCTVNNIIHNFCACEKCAFFFFINFEGSLQEALVYPLKTSLCILRCIISHCYCGYVCPFDSFDGKLLWCMQLYFDKETISLDWKCAVLTFLHKTSKSMTYLLCWQCRLLLSISTFSKFFPTLRYCISQQILASWCAGKRPFTK